MLDFYKMLNSMPSDTTLNSEQNGAWCSFEQFERLDYFESIKNNNSDQSGRSFFPMFRHFLFQNFSSELFILQL